MFAALQEIGGEEGRSAVRKAAAAVRSAQGSSSKKTSEQGQGAGAGGKGKAKKNSGIAAGQRPILPPPGGGGVVPLPPTPSAPLTWEKVGAGSGVPKKAAKKKAARAQGQGDAASLGSGTAFDLLEEESPADHGQGGVAQAAMKLQVSDPFWEAEGGQWCCTVTRASGHGVQVPIAPVVMRAMKVRPGEQLDLASFEKDRVSEHYKKLRAEEKKQKGKAPPPPTPPQQQQQKQKQPSSGKKGGDTSSAPPPPAPAAPSPANPPPPVWGAQPPSWSQGAPPPPSAPADPRRDYQMYYEQMNPGIQQQHRQDQQQYQQQHQHQHHPVQQQEPPHWKPEFGGEQQPAAFQPVGGAVASARSKQKKGKGGKAPGSASGGPGGGFAALGALGGDEAGEGDGSALAVGPPFWVPEPEKGKKAGEWRCTVTRASGHTTELCLADAVPHVRKLGKATVPELASEEIDDVKDLYKRLRKQQKKEGGAHPAARLAASPIPAEHAPAPASAPAPAAAPAPAPAPASTYAPAYAPYAPAPAPSSSAPPPPRYTPPGANGVAASAATAHMHGGRPQLAPDGYSRAPPAATVGVDALAQENEQLRQELLAQENELLRQELMRMRAQMGASSAAPTGSAAQRWGTERGGAPARPVFLPHGAAPIPASELHPGNGPRGGAGHPGFTRGGGAPYRGGGRGRPERGRKADAAERWVKEDAGEEGGRDKGSGYVPPALRKGGGQKAEPKAVPAAPLNPFGVLGEGDE